MFAAVFSQKETRYVHLIFAPELEPEFVSAGLVAVAPGTFAQIGGGSVVGNVTDQSGAIITNATVKVTNTATGVTNTSVTNTQGYYEFPLLPAGRYVVEVQATGFQSKKTAEFELNAGTRPRFDFALNAGNVTESVTVEGGTPLVNATTTELGTVIDQRKLQQLPLNGRNYEALLGLQAGVVVRPPSTVGGRGASSSTARLRSATTSRWTAWILRSANTTARRNRRA